jgi:perosamine synthetase
MTKFIPISEPSITSKEVEYVTDAVRSGWISSLGKYVDAFEEQFAAFCGTKYAVAVSNGTTALHLALVAYGIGPGDEVIVPDFTFIATANAVKHAGADVKLVDIEENTLCIDPNQLRSAITARTKAVIPVHIYGHPADMTKIMKIAKERNLIVIEDAAEAHGAEVNGVKVGSIGNCGTFSFYGNKIITTGEGGMITSNDDVFIQKVRHLRDHAMSKKKRYWHDDIGYNYRITNLQAALGLAQVERIKELLTHKKRIFTTYKQYLSGDRRCRLNYEAPWAKNVYWMVSLEIDTYDEDARDQLILRLKKENIDSRPYFYPISDMSMYGKEDTPVTHKVYKRGINLPSYYALQNDTIEYICKKVIKSI